jgi:signal peptidase I, bacterial type
MAKPANRESKTSQSPAPSSTPPGMPQSSLPVWFRWFFSKTVRQATAMRKHVKKLLDHQRDILSAQAVEAVESAIASCRQAVAEYSDKPALEKQMENLEKIANKWLKPYPNAAWRENVEVLLVALAVAMGIRTFFLQPFKIPTGSMQPTLYGVTSENLINEPDFKIPTGLTRVREWFEGISYIHLVAENDGPVEAVERPFRILIFNLWQKVVAGGKPFMIWFPPDYGSETLESRARLQFGKEFHKGEDIVKLRVRAGDHLFVDRLTYNFRPPKRGEIIVFETKGIPEENRQRFGIPGDQFYIKRLVGLGGETLSLESDYKVNDAPQSSGTVEVGRLTVDGKPLSASFPHFENLYSFYGASRASSLLDYKQNHYYGHALIGVLAPGQTYNIEPGHFFVMGDNTMNSLDSRYWGGFPSSAVIGSSCFVYWPITARFGWGNR